MNVLALTNLYPNPLQPHLAPWNHAQLKALASRNSVSVIAPILWRDELALTRQTQKRLPGDRLRHEDGITIHHPRYYYFPKLFRSTYGYSFQWSVTGTFRSIIQECKPDVVYAAWAYPDGWAAVRLASASSIPVVIRVLGSDVLQLDDFPGRKRRTLEALQRAERVVAVSQDLAYEVAKLGIDESRIDIVYNGLDTTVFCPGSQEEARSRLGLPIEVPAILFVGNLVPVKQVDVLLAACAALRSSGIHFHCHVLGDGPLRSLLTDSANQLGLDHHVTFHGQCPQEELVHWYRSSDVVVLPSQSEGIPNVLLEATACGIPFVASRVGGIGEIEAVPRSTLVPSGDVTALAGAIERLLVEPEDFSGSAAVIIPARSWEESAADLEAVFRFVASPRTINNLC